MCLSETHTTNEEKHNDPICSFILKVPLRAVSYDFFYANMASKAMELFASGDFVTLLKILATLFLVFAPIRAEIRSAVLDEQSGQLTVIEGYREDFVAWANFTDDIKTTG